MTKILVIDDRGRLTSAQENLLQAGIEVSLAHCAISGIEFAAAHPTDLVLCADPLPVLQGLDFLELKNMLSVEQAPAVIMLCEHEEKKLEYFKAGCDDFMLLPCDDTELLFRISAILKRRSNNGVQGNFKDISFLDLIQMFMSAHRSGLLKVIFSTGSGSIALLDGQVIYASLSEYVGEQAFLEILRNSQTEGSFCFTSEEPSIAVKNIDKRTDHLLLGLANLLDEESSPAR